MPPIPTFIDQIIKKEVDSRKSNGTLEEDFKVWKCLIKFIPTERTQIIEFNDEITWTLKCEADTTKYTPGTPVYLHELHKIESVSYPSHKGNPVAYVFLFWSGLDYSMIFDLRLNDRNFDAKNLTVNDDLNLKRIANYYNTIFAERTILNLPKEQKEMLKSEKYFITPSILPYPINSLLNNVVNLENFESELKNYFDKKILKDIKNNWFTNSIFSARRKVFEDTFKTYENELWSATINTLTPQVEGLLRDFLFQQKGQKEYMDATKALDFVKKEVEEKKQIMVFNLMIETFSEAMSKTGGFMRGFKEWSEELGTELVSRHGVSHGKYNENTYTKINAIKMFLILDTLFLIVSAAGYNEPYRDVFTVQGKQ